MLVENHASRLVVEAIFLWIPKWQKSFFRQGFLIDCWWGYKASQIQLRGRTI